MDDTSLILRRLGDGFLLSGSSAIEVLIDPVQQWAASLQADGAWSDIDYEDQNTASWKTAEHLSR
ncbi:MAG TPA: hypothetical protein VFO07_14020, partial [Roseiflexaceae bacterium]|nr:hypothetical protein [Roseiflexaceae bacterium]